jgi:hypothetical protein
MALHRALLRRSLSHMFFVLFVRAFVQTAA